MKFILSTIGAIFLSVCAGCGLYDILSRFMSWDGEPAICILAAIFLVTGLIIFVVEEL